MGNLPLAYVFDLGWLRIGPPYIYVNIDPVIVHLGPIALRWYGLMYVVAILIALQAIKSYTKQRGIGEETVYRVLWWCIAAGVIGGRLYFVIQQPDLVQHYLLNPIRIIATWEGGMAFYGAIFLVLPTLVWRAKIERLNPLDLLDAGVLFGAVGQIFGRIGNLINGDIIGYPSTLPWSTVYQHPASWACLPGSSTCNIPVQPAAGYELLTNLVLLAIMLLVARYTRRPGLLMLVYLFGYTITQFSIFFTRANDIVPFLGLNWGLKQAQWTSLIVFIALIPLSVWIVRHSKPVPQGEDAATYGIPQTVNKTPLIQKTLDGEEVHIANGEITHVTPEHSEEVVPTQEEITPIPSDHTEAISPKEEIAAETVSPPIDTDGVHKSS